MVVRHLRVRQGVPGNQLHALNPPATWSAMTRNERLGSTGLGEFAAGVARRAPAEQIRNIAAAFAARRLAGRTDGRATRAGAI